MIGLPLNVYLQKTSKPVTSFLFLLLENDLASRIILLVHGLQPVEKASQQLQFVLRIVEEVVSFFTCVTLGSKEYSGEEDSNKDE